MCTKSELVREAVALALKCVATGETLLPFIITAGCKESIISIDGNSAAENIGLAQSAIDRLPPETSGWVFAYDGFLTLDEQRTDAIFVEAAERSSEGVEVYAQRYSAGSRESKAVPIGTVGRLPNMPGRLSNAKNRH